MFETYFLIIYLFITNYRIMKGIPISTSAPRQRIMRIPQQLLLVLVMRKKEHMKTLMSMKHNEIKGWQQ